MAKLSDSEIVSVARAAGLTGNNVAIATAIALAESGGDPKSHNAIPPDNSYGLWQINMLGPLGPARRKQFNLTSNDQLYDPATNAKAMMAISNNGSNWKPWTTYTSGRYLAFMSRAGFAAAGTRDQAQQWGDGSNLDSSIIDKLTSPVTWRIAALTFVGAMLILIGFVALFGSELLGGKLKTVANIASKVGKK